MVPSAAAWRHLQRPRYNAFSISRKCVLGDLDLWPLTLTFKLVQAKDQTRLPCESGANPFSNSRDIWFTNKKNKQKVTGSAKNRTLRSPLCAVKTINTKSPVRDRRQLWGWEGFLKQMSYELQQWKSKAVMDDASGESTEEKMICQSVICLIYVNN